jgi:hypothetical protein
MTALSRWMSPRWRWLKATSRTRSADRAAATIASASAALRAIGFSQSTCMPRSSAAIAGSTGATGSRPCPPIGI